MSDRVPNFFIVGAGKAGTTSLYEYLRQHPQIYMSPVKEPCYFASEIRGRYLDQDTQRHVEIQSRHLPGLINDGRPVKPMGWLAEEWDDYLRLFQGASTETAIGEASAAYLWSSSAAGNIRARLPGAKIIMILRDPADRAFSQYLHQLAVGLTRATFREHIRQCERQHDGKLNIWHPFLEAGLYYEQVKRFLDAFPREQIRMYQYELDWQDPNRLLKSLFEFLSVDSTHRPDTSHKDHERRAPRLAGVNYYLKHHNLWSPLKALIPGALRPAARKLLFNTGRLKMDEADRRFLVGYYREDVLKLASLWNRDLHEWLK